MSKTNGGRVPRKMDPVKAAKAIAHPLRVRILEKLGEGGDLSPNDLAKLLREPLTNVSYHVRMLEELDAITLVGTEPRRGALEHYYRAQHRVTITTERVTRRRAELVS